MSSPEFFRREAERCLALSDACVDPAVAAHLRVKAGDFLDRALELEALERDLVTIRDQGSDGVDRGRQAPD